MMKRVHLGFIAILFVVASVVSFASDDKAVAAEKAVTEWLTLVDSEQYDASWNEAASLFKGQISSADWAKAVGSVRKPLGAVVNRKLISATHKTSLPGAPDGDYIVLQFQTEFESKSRAVETVTPKLEEGKWKVTGYYVR